MIAIVLLCAEEVDFIFNPWRSCRGKLSNGTLF